MNIVRKVPEYVLPIGLVIVVGVISLLLILLEFAGNYAINSHRESPPVTCTPTKQTVVGDTGAFAVEFDCGGKPVAVSNGELLVKYFNNPGPITCRVDGNGNGTCDPRP